MTYYLQYSTAWLYHLVIDLLGMIQYDRNSAEKMMSKYGNHTTTWHNATNKLNCTGKSAMQTRRGMVPSTLV